MIHDMDIVWFSLDRVENKYSSTSFSLAKELARNNRVFFIDNPVTYHEWHRSKRVLPSTPRYFRAPNTPDNFLAVTPPRTLPINWMSTGHLYRAASQINNHLLMRSIDRLVADHAIRDFVFVNVFNPFYTRHFTGRAKPRLKVYYSVDDIRYSPYMKKHGPALEKEIVDAYDLTLTTSKELQSLLSGASKPVHYLPNAADIPLFQSARTKSFPKPEDIVQLDKPIIIYTGHVDWRVDIAVLKKVAELHHDKVLLLVGPVSLDHATLESLKTFPNIVFTGSKPLELLPSYLQHAHCAIIPFKCNTLTKSIYPLKINEYLAAGLPVVSTNFSEDIRQFAGIIELEDQAIDFSTKIETSIRQDSEALKQKRSQAAEKNSWTSRADSFWEIIRKHL